MKNQENEEVKAAACAKLKKIQQSAGYKSFFNESAIEAFGRVQALERKSLGCASPNFSCDCVI
ncbi:MULTISPECIES: hypothetical protein [Pseudomonas]|nr:MULTISPECIES: hypothetical protein [Pseudomonas]MBH3472854.1 hypothetical protein [Pseudomonas putida]MDH2187272.1 hypothetical protein [Pseudomonas sp. GD03651]MQT29225.1 hypothetical protein [Pseudomonas helleri]MQT52563.1 hypothetical protein [Pseudomonas sp. FSL R10-2398]MQU13226.1 hypothetical protein [Pseudomonas sp. FSL R10-2189]